MFKRGIGGGVYFCRYVRSEQHGGDTMRGNGMLKYSRPAAIALVLAVLLAVAVEAATGVFSNMPNPGNSLLGYHVYGTETNSRGYSLDGDNSNSPQWSVGLERTNGDFFI